MKTIDETRLETDVVYRVGYVSEFLGFDSEDIAAIHAAAGHLAPLVPGLVDAVYDKLHSYDATWRHFAPGNRATTGRCLQLWNPWAWITSRSNFARTTWADTWWRWSPGNTIQR